MQQVGVVGRPVHHQLLQHPAHPADGLQPGGRPDHQLGHQRVVVGRQGVAAVQAGVHPDAAAPRQMQEVDLARAGLEVVGGVLGVDPALDGVAPEGDLLLGVGQGQPRGDADLLPHQVHPGDEFSDRVLHLDPGVHLDEIEVAVGVQHELDGAGVLVVGRFGGGHGGRAHLLPQLGGQGAGGRLLQHLLVAALDGAVPLPQLDHMAHLVGHDLELDVLGVEDQLFQVHLAAAKAGHRLAAGLLKEGDQLVGLKDAAHPAPAAAGRGLDEDRIADGIGQGLGLFGGGHRAVRAGHHRHPRLLHQPAGGGLVAHGADDVPGGADEGDAGLRAGVGKLVVLAQKAVAGVDGVAVGGLGHRQDGVHIQIAVRCPGGADAVGLFGKLHMDGLGVGGGIDHHRLDLQFTAGPLDAQGDLAAVCNQNTLEHGLTLPGSGSGRPQRTPGRRLPAGSLQ